jgi:1-phosphatidylinositol-4-phosphate 5-kinase
MLIAQVKSDTMFLQRLNIVDYSMLVGQRSRTISVADSLDSTSAGRPVHHHRSHSQSVAGLAARSPAVSANAAPTFHHARGPSLVPGAHLGTPPPPGQDGPLPSFDPNASDELDGRCFRSHDGGMVSLPVHTGGREAREDTFYIGIVDVLQPYSTKKKLENVTKSIFYDATKISVVPPPEFAIRLCCLVERITV